MTLEGAEELDESLDLPEILPMLLQCAKSHKCRAKITGRYPNEDDLWLQIESNSGGRYYFRSARSLLEWLGY